MRTVICSVLIAWASPAICQDSSIFDGGWQSTLPQPGVTSRPPFPPFDPSISRISPEMLDGNSAWRPTANGVKSYVPCLDSVCGPLWVPNAPSGNLAASGGASGSDNRTPGTNIFRPESGATQLSPSFGLDRTTPDLFPNSFDDSYLLDGDQGVNGRELRAVKSSYTGRVREKPVSSHLVAPSNATPYFSRDSAGQKLLVKTDRESAVRAVESVITAAMFIEASKACSSLAQEFLLIDRDCEVSRGFSGRSFLRDDNYLLAVEKLPGFPPSFRIRIVAPSSAMSNRFSFGFESYRLQVVFLFSLDQPIVATEVFALEARQYSNVDAFDRLVAMQFVGVDLLPDYLSDVDRIRKNVQEVFINLLQASINERERQQGTPG